MLLIPGLALVLLAITAVNGQTRQNEVPRPFQYAYRNVHEYGGGSFHESTGDGSGRVSGSYGLTDPDGRNRLVVYVADELGYRATVTSNEPGLDASQGSPANVELRLANTPVAVAQPPRRVVVAPQARPVYVRPQAVPVRPSGAYRVVSVPRNTGGYRVVETARPQVDYVYVRPGSPYYP